MVGSASIPTARRPWRHSEVALSGGGSARVALSLFPKLAPPRVPVPSHLAGVEILGALAVGLARDSGQCHRAPEPPRNNIHVPKSSPGTPALGREGSAPLPHSSPRELVHSQQWGSSWCSLSTDIHLLGSTFSCTTTPPPPGLFQPHIKGSRARSLPHSTAWLCPTLLGGPCCPPSAQHHEVAGRAEPRAS